MPLRYVVSDRFDYTRVICRDVGPRYAESLGLACCRLSDIEAPDATALFVDSRLTEDEIPFIRALIERSSIAVLLKIVDPYWRSPDSAPHYYSFIEGVCDRPNVALVSMYEPSEWLDRLMSRKSQARLLVLPYPYIEACERTLTPETFAERRHQVLVTGAASKRRYPARAEIIRKRGYDPRYAAAFEVLEHPGYPDIGEVLRHRLIGDEFIAYMAGFQLFFVCPSRADLEFLKYTECAYAGCAPVGKPASSLPGTAKEQFLNADALARSLQTCDSDEELFERAMAYRAAMKGSRNSHALRDRLLDFARHHF